ncbi:hypothetical protein [Hoeflea sp.]|uniref:hypothetical protein n=1 Tax=Hoeflea sp. TaxID=1940281 RepID=UPI003BAE65EB
MPRTFIGIDSTGEACLKITKDSSDDPRTTLDASRHLFHYNSKDEAVADIVDIKQAIHEPLSSNWIFSGGAGTSADFVTAHQAYYGQFGGFVANTFYGPAAFPELDYACPLLDFKFKDGGDKFIDMEYAYRPYTNGGYYAIGGEPDVFYPGSAFQDGQYAGPIGGSEYRFTSATGFSSAHTFSGALLGLKDIDANVERYGTCIVWNLPGDNQPVLQAAPATPTPGEKVIEITPSTLKIAKPGYDVSTATKQQLAFAAEKRPAKVIASGDILIAATSTTTFNIGFTVDATVYLDVQYYDAAGGDLYFPASPALAFYGAKHYISGSTVYFENAGVACRARFVVVAEDTLGPSSGSNNVFQTFEEDGQKVVRLLAPGAGDPPRLSDIVIDSRWPTMPILAEGYIDVNLAGQRTWPVTFTNPGLQPFVKMSVITAVGGRLLAGPPVIRWLIRSGEGFSGDTVFAHVVSSTQVDFWTFRGKAVNAFTGSNGSPFFAWFTPPVVGIRYFIFGIPV